MNKKQLRIFKKIENENKMKQITRHHIINKASKDLFNVFHDKNTTPMNRLDHDHRHICHKGEHPLETLQKTERFTQVMSESATELYQALISMSIEEFYQDKFLKKGL